MSREARSQAEADSALQLLMCSAPPWIVSFAAYAAPTKAKAARAPPTLPFAAQKGGGSTPSASHQLRLNPQRRVCKHVDNP